jgi:hypothetical protein
LTRLKFIEARLRLLPCCLRHSLGEPHSCFDHTSNSERQAHCVVKHYAFTLVLESNHHTLSHNNRDALLLPDTDILLSLRAMTGLGTRSVGKQSRTRHQMYSVSGITYRNMEAVVYNRLHVQRHQYDMTPKSEISALPVQIQPYPTKLVAPSLWRVNNQKVSCYYGVQAVSFMQRTMLAPRRGFVVG